MRGTYIVAVAVLAALAGGGCGGRTPDTSPPARTISALGILQKDIAYIIGQQRAGNSYGLCRKEHPAPGGKIITDGFTLPAPIGLDSITLGTAVSPSVDGLERVTFFGNRIAVVDWEANGSVDRLVVTLKPYDPNNPDLDPDLDRNVHPGGNFPQAVADQYLAAIATIITEKGRTGTVETAMKYELARNAVIEALGK